MDELTRRDFAKALGLAGAGVAALNSPVSAGLNQNLAIGKKDINPDDYKIQILIRHELTEKSTGRFSDELDAYSVDIKLIKDWLEIEDPRDIILLGEFEESKYGVTGTTPATRITMISYTYLLGVKDDTVYGNLKGFACDASNTKSDKKTRLMKRAVYAQKRIHGGKAYKHDKSSAVSGATRDPVGKGHHPALSQTDYNVSKAEWTWVR